MYRPRLDLAAACLLVAAASGLVFPAVARATPCPNIMLVLDQSGSMAQDVDGNEPFMQDGKTVNPTFHAPSKWQILQDTVIDLVRTYGDRVPFGLELFTSDAYRNDDKCYADTMINVPVSHDSPGAIIQKIRAASPGAQTNTGEAIKRAAADMSLNNLGANGKKKRFIILVTDGIPTCNTGDKDGSSPSYSESQIGMAKSMGINTFVVGFDGGTTGQDVDKLNNMSYYGGCPSPGGCANPNMPCGSMQMPPIACYYKAGADAAAFKATIDGILTTIGAGEFNSMLCDDSCYTQGCPAGQICTTDELNPVAHCVNDPCGKAKCSGDQFCRGGACAHACSHGCGKGTKCEDGSCVPDVCADKVCPGAGQICNPATGACIDNPCADCRKGFSVCDIATGKCVQDQCAVITCPAGLTCSNNGNCSMAAGVTKGGCSTVPVGDDGRRGGAALAGLALVSMLALILGRRRRVLP